MREKITNRDAIYKIYITVLLFVFSPGDVVAPLTISVIGYIYINCEEDTEIRQQGPQVDGNQLPGI